MDIKSNPMRTTLSFTLSILFHVSLVAGGAVLGAFFASNKAPQAKGEQSYEVSVSEVQQAAPPTVETPAPAPEPSEPTVVAEAPVAKPVAQPKVAKSKPVVAKKAAPAKKIVVTDFSEAKAEPQAVVEVNESLNEQQAPETEAVETQEEVAVAPAQEETVVKSEDIKEEAPVEAAPTAEEVAEQKAQSSASEQKEALAKVAPVAAATEAAGSKTGSEDAPASKEAPQNFLTLKQAPGNRPPSYPNDLRLKQVQGKGQLKYYVNKDGRVGQLEVTQSSGSNELDQAAVDAFSKYKFVPGQEGYTIHNFEFSLKGPAEAATRRLRTSYNK